MLKFLLYFILLVFLKISEIKCQCDQRTERIIGGNNADANDDFVVRILSYNTPGATAGYLSTGVAVSNFCILTVAQAVDGYQVFTLFAGSNNIGSMIQYPETELGFVHPNYNSTTLQYNIGIIVASLPLPDIFLPIALNQPVTVSGETIFVFGVGYTDATTNSLPLVVQYAEQTLVLSDVCVRFYNSLVVTDMNLCGESLDDTTTPWHGDQGGPVLNTNRELLGVVSAFGRTTSTPTIFINIYQENVFSFINEITNQFC